MTTEPNIKDTTTRRQDLARAYAGARALTSNDVITETTNDKTFRGRQISICLSTTPKRHHVNTRPRARTHARQGTPRAIDFASAQP